jgi:hypothetical protein
MMLIQF